MGDINERKMGRGGIWLLSVFFAMILFVNLAGAMTVTINIPERYSEVRAGEKIYFETEVKWPENTERKDLRLEYSIKTPNDEEIAYLKVLKAIETQASFMDSMNIPTNTPAGTYTLFLNMNDYGQLNQEVAVSFRVIGIKEDSVRLYLLVILGAVGLIALVSLIELFILIKRKK